MRSNGWKYLTRFFSSFDVADCEALPDCDTEFIHFSEKMDLPAQEPENLVSLETFQPTSDHQQYAAMIKQLQVDGPEIVMDQTTLLQSHYTIVSDNSTVQDNTRLAPLAFSKGLSLTEILSVTGTFDVEQFNKGFEEDTLRFLSEQERERKHIEDLREAFEQEDELEDIPPLPLDEDKFKEAIKSREMIHKPISTWFSRQLILMSVRELQNNHGKSLVQVIQNIDKEGFSLCCREAGLIKSIYVST